MEIIYRDIKEFSEQDLERLFLSVEWESGKYPDRLFRALKNYGSVFTAWDGARLVGMIAAMDDGEMTAYVHYLLVDPAYQKRGIGRQLIEKVKQRYRDYLKIVLIAENTAVKFYERCGFTKSGERSPMFIDRA